MPINSFNPFSGDSDLRKQILSKEGRLDPDSYTELPDEQYDNTGIEQDLRSIITNAPAIPKSAKTVIHDASALARTEREAKANEIKLAMNEVLTKYNQEYGLDLNLNLDSMSDSLTAIATPEKRRVLELYLSEVMQSIRPILYLNIIQKLWLVIDNVLSPEKLLNSPDFNSADMLLVVDKLIGYITTLNDMFNEIRIKDSDQVLKKLSEDKNDATLDSPESKAAIEEFMKLFKKENLEK